MGEVFYCDNYEELTGRERDGQIRDEAVEAKVVQAPKHASPKSSDLQVETKAAE